MFTLLISPHLYPYPYRSLLPLLSSHFPLQHGVWGETPAIKPHEHPEKIQQSNHPMASTTPFALYASFAAKNLPYTIIINASFNNLTLSASLPPLNPFKYTNRSPTSSQFPPLLGHPLRGLASLGGYARADALFSSRQIRHNPSLVDLWYNVKHRSCM